MKKTILMAIAACMMTLGTQAQVKNQPNISQEVYDVVEEMPVFPGGIQGMIKFLSENISYPKEAQKKKISGRVLVSFVVEKNGSVSEVQTERSLYPSLDEEAVRVVKSMPNWIPGKQGDQVVRVKYTLPVTFSLD